MTKRKRGDGEGFTVGSTVEVNCGEEGWMLYRPGDRATVIDTQQLYGDIIRVRLERTSEELHFHVSNVNLISLAPAPHVPSAIMVKLWQTRSEAGDLTLVAQDEERILVHSCIKYEGLN